MGRIMDDNGVLKSVLEFNYLSVSIINGVGVELNS